MHSHTDHCLCGRETSALVRLYLARPSNLGADGYRYIPPVVDTKKSNVKNSENTALFLVSCFEYILAGVVLNAGPPFRQSMMQNCEDSHTPRDGFNLLTSLPGPFMATIGVTLLVTVYMVLGPAHWLKKLMALTKISWDFKFFIIAMGLAYFVTAWAGERYVFQRVARLIVQTKRAITKRTKKRKEYKVIQERMRV